MVISPKVLLSAITALLLAWLAVLAVDYKATVQANRLIGKPDGIDVNADLPADVLFARAWQLAAGQDPQAALGLYNRVANLAEKQGDDKLWQACHYNMGLLYLRQALDAHSSGDAKQHGQWLALAELAKAEFKTVVMADPAHYDARLSMEQTLRLLPDEKATVSGWKEQRSSTHSHVAGVAGGGP